MLKKILTILLVLTTYLALAIAQEAEHDHDHDHEGHDHAHEDEDSHAGHDHAGHDHAGHSHGPTSLEDCVAITGDEYNVGLRVGAIFIIMAATVIGVFAPIVLHRIRPYSQGSVRHWILTVGKFFGTGIILGVAFIHMIPEAVERFTSPCITSGKWGGYHGFVGLFALIAVFFIQIVELAVYAHVTKKQKMQQEHINSSANSTENKDVENSSAVKGEEAVAYHHDGHAHMMIEDSKDMRDVSTIVLELGIVIHSVIIGLTLGFTSDDGFNVLLIALVFHQFFEGIALGTRINDMEHKSFIKPFIMGSIFSLTTPVGVAIGIGVNMTVNPFSQSSVLGQAILDSLAAGILLYNAFISLIAGEINHNMSFLRSSLSYKAICFIAMYIGAAVMAILGKWA
ncbi:ZIP zinc transporter-domain-containing protein [Zychaea mexicana]|uniref:ZIP zinc transporter-domain-containing protein n=1 Tax=Zychaea mexicana TaxID=64656 RepID=UPI0022FEEC41|nr:ZIP zinc transporter-domain-containing protein [Zychaea mexicana]KAI9496268.1 ZIP zinc transporter-domain-containing protein [Zychaea mexicana]